MPISLFHSRSDQCSRSRSWPQYKYHIYTKWTQLASGEETNELSPSPPTTNLIEGDKNPGLEPDSKRGLPTPDPEAAAPVSVPMVIAFNENHGLSSHNQDSMVSGLSEQDLTSSVRIPETGEISNNTESELEAPGPHSGRFHPLLEEEGKNGIKRSMRTSGGSVEMMNKRRKAIYGSPPSFTAFMPTPDSQLRDDSQEIPTPTEANFSVSTEDSLYSTIAASSGSPTVSRSASRQDEPHETLSAIAELITYDLLFGRRSKAAETRSLFVLDFDTPIENYSQAQAKLVKRTADVLFTLSYYKEAFRLYYLTLRQLGVERNHNHSTLIAIIACVRSAVTPADLEVVRDILLQRHQDLDPDCVTCSVTLEHFIIHRLLADVYQRQGDASGASDHECIANEIVTKMDYFLGSDTEGTTINILHSCLIRQTMKQAESAEALPRHADLALNSTLEQQTQKRRKAMRMAIRKAAKITVRKTDNRTVIREIWNWCVKQIWAMSSESGHHKASFELCHDGNKSEHIAICCYFWRKWSEDMESAIVSGEWAMETEMSIGISIAELLSILALAIVKEVEQKHGVSDYVEKKFWDLMQRALYGVRALSNLSDEGLTSEIAKYFATGAHLLDIKKDDPRYQPMALNINGDFVQDIFAVDLQALTPYSSKSSLTMSVTPPTPKKPPDLAAPDPVDNGHSGTQSRTSASTSSIYYPQVAPSLSSSSMASFRRLAARIRQENSLLMGDRRPTWWSESEGKSLMSIWGGYARSVDELSEDLGAMSVTGQGSSATASSAARYPVPPSGSGTLAPRTEWF